MAFAALFSAAAAVLLAVLCMPAHSEAKVVAGVVLPHGDFVYDPTLVHDANGSLQLHDAAVKVGDWLSNVVKPDGVVLSTPHGLELETDFVFYMNRNESGHAVLGEDLHNASFPTYDVYMNASVDTGLTDTLLRRLHRSTVPVQGLKGFAGSMTLPISWGEIIPLSFLSERLRENLILIGQPLRRYNHSVAMIPELLDLGRVLYEELEKDPRTFAVLISSDLAHTHLASGPYGYCPCAEPFDRDVNRWAETQNADALLVDAARQQQLGAMSCGFTGLVMLQGLLAQAKFTSKSLANFHPTYYGMMVATFTRVE